MVLQSRDKNRSSCSGADPADDARIAIAKQRITLRPARPALLAGNITLNENERWLGKNVAFARPNKPCQPGSHFHYFVGLRWGQSAVPQGPSGVVRITG